jgi:hypothetical protein
MNGFLGLSTQSQDGYTYIRDHPSGTTWQHLACFAAGNYAFGAYYLNDYEIPSGDNVCYAMKKLYNSS